VEARGDIYSLGATYYFLLTGRPPFPGDSAVQVMFAHCSTPAPDPRAVAPDVPAGCAEVVARALAKKRGDRFPDARAMVAALEALLPPDAPTAPVDTLVTPPPRPAPPTRRRWLYAAGTTAALGVAGYWAMTRPRPLRSGPFALRPGVQLVGHANEVRTARFTPDGSLLATAGSDKGAIVWSMPSGARKWTLYGHAGGASSAAFAPDGRTLASGGQGDPVCIWAMEDGSLLKAFKEAFTVQDLAFSPDGLHLVAAIGYGGLVAFKREGRAGLDKAGENKLAGHYAHELGFTPAGRLVVVEHTHSVSVLDGAALKPMYSLTGKARLVAFSPDRRTLAVCLDDALVLWHPEGGTRGRVGDGRPWAAAFSPDGGTLAWSSSDDGSLRLRHLATRDEQSYRPQGTGVRSLAFSPDGMTLVSTGFKDGVVQLWDVVDA